MLNGIFVNFEESQSGDIKKNINMLFVSHRAEKKIKKILQIKNGSVTAYCSEKILNADKIVNGGRISGCTKGGNYLFIYKDKELFIINSATYEIISAKRKAL